MEVKVIIASVLVLLHCVYASQALDLKDDTRESLYAGRIGLLEQRLRDDVIRELRDIEKLEDQLNKNIGFVHEKKRQLEIKRSQPLRCLVNSEACL